MLTTVKEHMEIIKGLEGLGWQEIFFKIKPGRNGGIQLASVKSLLLSIIKVKKEEKESYIKALSEFFDLEHTFIQETLNKLAERPETDTLCSTVRKNR